MRITNNMLISNMLSSMQNNLSRTSLFQNQLATGKKISKPSDDPIVASKSLKLRTDVAEIAQYKRNAEDATSWMGITENTISQMGEVLQRTRELTVQAANGTNTQDDMQKIQSEMEQLKKQLTQMANATYAGRHVFSGFKTDKPLMDDEGNFLLNVANAEKIQYEIGIGDNININVTAGDLFNRGADAVGNTAGFARGNGTVAIPLTIVAGTNDTLTLTLDGAPVSATLPAGTYSDHFVLLTAIQSSINTAAGGTDSVVASFSGGRLLLTSTTTGATSSVTALGGNALADLGMTTNTSVAGSTGTKGSMMQLFDDLLAGLSVGDNGAVGALLGDIDLEMGNLLRVRSGVGARMNRLELTTNRLDDDYVGFTKLMSQNEDVDMAEAIMNLKSEEAVYQASLSTGAKVIQPSLVDYIR
jgi:flagellar hook-associated protein 3 FlgL